MESKSQMLLSRATLVFGLSLLPVTSYAADVEVLRHVQETVTAMCRGGTVEGNSKTYEVQGGVDGTYIIIKGLIGLSADGKARFTHKEWKGVETTLRKNYTQCVQYMMPLFLDKLDTD